MLQNISDAADYKNFGVTYIDNPFNLGSFVSRRLKTGFLACTLTNTIPAIAQWQAAGNEVWQLIEPVDGFHPNQFAQPLVVNVVWELIAANFPHLMPPVNPNNADIRKIFGDQGGH